MAKVTKPKIDEIKSSAIQLERMKFSKFEGDIRKYPKFKEEFHIHIRPICSVSQLPFILRSYLSDAIQDEVDNAGNDYNAIWERLDAKYGDKGRLVDAVMADNNYFSTQLCSILHHTTNTNITLAYIILDYMLLLQCTSTQNI